MMKEYLFILFYVIGTVLMAFGIAFEQGLVLAVHIIGGIDSFYIAFLINDPGGD